MIRRVKQSPAAPGTEAAGLNSRRSRAGDASGDDDRRGGRFLAALDGHEASPGVVLGPMFHSQEALPRALAVCGSRPLAVLATPEGVR